MPNVEIRPLSLLEKTCMNNAFVSFEFNVDQDCIEIHFNAEGRDKLFQHFRTALEAHDHQHLMTSEWGGGELSSEKQGNSNRLINHVKIIPWRE